MNINCNKMHTNQRRETATPHAKLPSEANYSENDNQAQRRSKQTSGGQTPDAITYKRHKTSLTRPEKDKLQKQVKRSNYTKGIKNRKCEIRHEFAYRRWGGESCELPKHDGEENGRDEIFFKLSTEEEEEKARSVRPKNKQQI